MKDATGQAARYLDLLSLYDFEIVHRSGARHMNADAVSRVKPCELGKDGQCRQCHKRVVGEHRINAVSTRVQRRKQKNHDGNAADGEAVSASQTSVARTDSDSGGRRKRHRGRQRRAPSLQATAPKACHAQGMVVTLAARSKAVH